MGDPSSPFEYPPRTSESVPANPSQRIRPSESVDVHEFREISLSKDRRPRQHVPLESLLIVGEKVCLRSMWTGKPMVSPVPRWRGGPELYGKMALA